jgi:hypothetical protein
MTTTGLPPVPSRTDLLLTITAVRGARQRATDPDGPGFDFFDDDRCAAGLIRAVASDLGSQAPLIALRLVADGLELPFDSGNVTTRYFARRHGVDFARIIFGYSEDAEDVLFDGGPGVVEFYDRALVVLEAQLALATADEPAETLA